LETEQEVTMYFDGQKCGYISGLWIAGIAEPWAGGLILGLQGNYTDKPDPMFTLLGDIWQWRIDSLFDIIMKPIMFLIVLAISLSAFLLKLAVMLCLLPLWLFVAVTISVRSGLPDYPQTWMSHYD
jgi:hypothetical protein